jgi:hypothetical protein
VQAEQALAVRITLLLVVVAMEAIRQFLIILQLVVAEVAQEVTELMAAQADRVVVADEHLQQVAEQQGKEMPADFQIQDKILVIQVVVAEAPEHQELLEVLPLVVTAV